MVPPIHMVNGNTQNYPLEITRCYARILINIGLLSRPTKPSPEQLYEIEFILLIVFLQLRVFMSISKLVALCSSERKNEGPCPSKNFSFCIVVRNCIFILFHIFCLPSPPQLSCLHPGDTQFFNWVFLPRIFWKTHPWCAPATVARKTNAPNLKHSFEMFGVLPTDPLGGRSNKLGNPHLLLSREWSILKSYP